MSFFQLLLTKEGLALWLILLASAVALVVFIERFLHCHRSQINSTEFLNGVRNVLRRNNVVEAISICDATPGPVARLVANIGQRLDHSNDGIISRAPPGFDPNATNFRSTNRRRH